ncbi:restriction endonuclease subunit S [Streptococcus infantis]|uniref:restriction endonuclease subunit S n=1 Tax=Streptococcus infantis TaxID=68892 RepID=UPI0039C23B90
MKNQNKKIPKIRFKSFEKRWESYRLSEYSSYRRGSFPQPYGNKEWYGGDNAMPFVQVVDVLENLRLVADTKQKISTLAQPMSVFVPSDSVIVTLQGSIGRVAITQYDAYVDRTILIFEDYIYQTNKEFWAYTIRNKFEIERQKAPGGTIKTITKEALSDFKVSIPNYSEQSSIGSLFRTLDDLLASYKDNLANYQSLKATMLSKMFPKAGQTVPEIRLDGFEGEWKIIKLGDVLSELKSGLSRELSNDDIGLPVIRANNISDGNLNLDSDIKYWYKEDPKGANTANYVVRENDILVNFINSEAKMGTAAIVLSEPDRETIYTTNILKLTVKEDYYPYFIYLMTLLQSYQYYIKAITKPAVNQASFTTVDFKKYEFLCPAFQEQQAIGSYFSNLDNLINSYKEKISQLETLKKKLLQDMFI